MIQDITHIKKFRKRLGLTQHELAKNSGVSQSLIAKIESGLLDPTYSKVKKIFQTLDDLAKKQEVNVSEIMTKKVISISPDDSIKSAITLMKKYNFSQMPVIINGSCIGVVSEANLLESLIENKGKIVKEIMTDSPPVVDKNSNVAMISQLLKYYQMVLVSENGKISGMLTKSDIINKMYQ